jgi:hypothetical protein
LLEGEEMKQVVNGNHDLWSARGPHWSEMGLFLIGDVENIVRTEVLLAVSPDSLGLLAPPMTHFTEGRSLFRILKNIKQFEALKTPFLMMIEKSMMSPS